MKKICLISGVTSGIGKATAEMLMEQNDQVIGLSRRQDRLDELKSRFKDRFRGYAVDVQNFAAVEKLFKEESNALNEVTVLINNAGLAKGLEPLYKGDVQQWEEMINTNVKGLLYLTRLALPAMIERNEGHVLNVGSVAGRWTYPGGAVYSATKFAVRALSESLRMDLLGKNIRVTNIEPGMVETEFSIVRLKSEEAAAKVYKGMTPLTAKDIAECISWSLNRPKHVNIQEMVVYPVDQASVQMVHRS